MKNLAGNRCECGACGLRFGSLYAFDHHRGRGLGRSSLFAQHRSVRIGLEAGLSGLLENSWKERVDTTPDIDTVEGIDND